MSTTVASLIEVVRQRDQTTGRLTVVGQVAAAVAIALVAWVISDWLVVTRLFGSTWWDLAARLTLWAVAGALVWEHALRGLVEEFRRRRSDDGMAMRLEGAFPELGGRLISTVQLKRTLEAGDHVAVGSPSLVEALAQDTEERIADLDPRTAVPSTAARRAVVLGLIAILFLGALALWKPGHALVGLGRLVFLPWQYPTATRIAGVTIQERVARGEPVAIEVTVDPTSEVPEFATATVRQGDGRTEELRLDKVADASSGKAIYRGSLKQAIEGVEVRPRAGDAQWPSWIAVSVLQRAALRQFTLRLTFPDYLKRAPEDSAVGDLNVPVGTKVALDAVFSQQVVSGSITVQAPGVQPADTVPPALPLTLAADGRSGKGAFSVEADGSWTVALVGANGLDSGEPVRFTIATQADKAPAIVVSFPSRDRDITRFARWPIRWSASDDHGIANGALRYRIIPAGADPDSITADPGRIPIPELASPGTGAVSGETWFDFTKLPLDTGARVQWWIEATDRRSPTPNVGRTPQGVFNVLDQAEMRERMLREKAELLTTLKQLRDRQKEARDASDAAAPKTPAAPTKPLPNGAAK